VLVSRSALQRRVRELGAQITADYAGGIVSRPPAPPSLLVLGILKGALFFFVDLVRSIDLPLAVDVVQAASYGARTQTSGAVRITQAPTAIVTGRDILVVDMVLDTGLTLRTLDSFLRAQSPARVRYCVLLSKDRDGVPPYPVEYVGFSIPNRWVVGYGGDYDDRYLQARLSDGRQRRLLGHPAQSRTLAILLERRPLATVGGRADALGEGGWTPSGFVTVSFISSFWSP
jgi:hypoxanthine phosphoribosyltransferase